MKKPVKILLLSGFLLTFMITKSINVMQDTQEVWKLTINGKYQISTHGRLMALGKQKKIIKLFTNLRGYYRYSVFSLRKNFTIHRLVAQAFIPNPNNLPEINHIDGNKLNNHVSNLEWCTRKENSIHYAKYLYKPSEKQRNAARLAGQLKRKKVIQFDLFGNELGRFISMREAENKTGIRCGNISSSCRGITSCCAGKYNFKYA